MVSFFSPRAEQHPTNSIDLEKGPEENQTEIPGASNFTSYLRMVAINTINYAIGAFTSHQPAISAQSLEPSMTERELADLTQQARTTDETPHQPAISAQSLEPSMTERELADLTQQVRTLASHSPKSETNLAQAVIIRSLSKNDLQLVCQSTNSSPDTLLAIADYILSYTEETVHDLKEAEKLILNRGENLSQKDFIRLLTIAAGKGTKQEPGSPTLTAALLNSIQNKGLLDEVFSQLGNLPADPNAYVVDSRMELEQKGFAKSFNDGPELRNLRAALAQVRSKTIDTEVAISSSEEELSVFDDQTSENTQISAHSHSGPYGNPVTSKSCS